MLESSLFLFYFMGFRVRLERIAPLLRLGEFYINRIFCNSIAKKVWQYVVFLAIL